MLGYQTPPWDQAGRRPPGTRQTPPRPGRHPPGPGRPPRTRQIPPGSGRHPPPRTRQTPPEQADTPPDQADPSPRTRQTPPGKQTAAYGLRAAGTHPTVMHSCFKVGHTERLFYCLIKTINSKRTLSDINAGAEIKDNKTDASREQLTNITVL